MDREQIVEGLKMALQRGQSLDSAVISFKNAGYPPAEIDAAAGEVQNAFQKRPPQPKIQPPVVKKKAKEQIKKKTKKEKIPKQKVSSYGHVKKPGVGKSFLLILLIFAALITIAGIITLIFFRPQLTDFLANLFP